MTKLTHSGSELHPAVKMYAEEHLDGKLSRREFLARASALGATTAGAYGLIGVPYAEAGGHSKTPDMGGTASTEELGKAIESAIA